MYHACLNPNRMLVQRDLKLYINGYKLGTRRLRQKDYHKFMDILGYWVLD